MVKGLFSGMAQVKDPTYLFLLHDRETENGLDVVLKSHGPNKAGAHP